MSEETDVKADKEWSKMDLFSLRNRVEHGRSVAHIAAFLTRTEMEVRAKAVELGLALRD